MSDERERLAAAGQVGRGVGLASVSVGQGARPVDRGRTGPATAAEFKAGDRVTVRKVASTGGLAGSFGTVKALTPGSWVDVVLDGDAHATAFTQDEVQHKSTWEADEPVASVHPLPLSSDDLAAQVGSFVKRAQQRVSGVGAEQYDKGVHGQKFERLPLPELCDWALEELEDVAVYAAMLAIRVQRLKAQFVGGDAA